MLSKSNLRWKHKIAADGNQCAGYVGYAFTETAFGFPITPATYAFEYVEENAHLHKKLNVFGHVPTVRMMQSEAGVAGAVHGASLAGSLTTTFTSSQGLLLMYPNLFKLRNSRTPAVFHIGCRSVTTTFGSIECDHSDMMAVRSAGLAMLSSASNQDVHDLAVVAHTTAMKSGLPFLNCYDGFRTSHQINDVEFLDYDELRSLVPFKELEEFRQRSLNPTHPTIRMLGCEGALVMPLEMAAQELHQKVPDMVDESMEKLSKLTGRRLRLFDYYGHKEAESVIVIMGSAAQNVQEAVDYWNRNGKKVGVITVRLFRPFSAKHLLKALPSTCKIVTVLDRVKEPGAIAQPLHLDMSNVVRDRPVIGGVYGLGGLEMTASQASTVIKNSFKANPMNHFSVGVVDDVTNTSLPKEEEMELVPESTKQCIFWGLGSDGTVGANKEAIAIICGNSDLHGQAFFAYDSKKSGGITRSHLRFGKEPQRSNYAIQNADFVAVHTQRFPHLYHVTKELKPGGTFLYNCDAKCADDLDKYLPEYIRRELADKKANVWVINASEIAEKAGIKGRINLIMQTAFFKLANIVPADTAIDLLKQAVQKNYGHQGENIVKSNHKAIDLAIHGIREIKVPEKWSTLPPERISRFANIEAPKIVKDLIIPVIELRGDTLKASNFVDIISHGPKEILGTSKYEKRGLATILPVWDSTKCIQCNNCSLGCAHAAIRPVLFNKKQHCQSLDSIPSKQLKGYDFRIDVSPYDCLGCGVCEARCPAKAISYVKPTQQTFEEMEKNHKEALKCPEASELPKEDAEKLQKRKFTPDGSQYMRPLMEYSGACGGCHETLYAKMLTQLFGPRLMVANATGCSIVWSSQIPSISWTYSNKGFGPTWSNSLFEDNAEFGMGQYTAFMHRRGVLRDQVKLLLEQGKASHDLAKELRLWLELYNDGEKVFPIAERIMDMLRTEKFEPGSLGDAIRRSSDLFIKPSVWAIGGDGWANDIGFAGLDHVIANNPDVNILVYDNEHYANTGFQMSKATPRSAVTKYASLGKGTPKKDLAFMMMNYPNSYVASVAIAANPRQTIKAMQEADAHPGASLLVAFCPCLGHGYRPQLGAAHLHQKDVIESGYWQLFRRNPNGKEKLILDAKEPSKEALERMFKGEVRYDTATLRGSEHVRQLKDQLAGDIADRYKKLLSYSK